MFKNSTTGIPKDKLPIEERYSARFFSLQDVFGELKFKKEQTLHLPWYYKIDNWEDYREFMSSRESKDISRPPKYILDYHEWNPIGEDTYIEEKK